MRVIVLFLLILNSNSSIAQSWEDSLVTPKRKRLSKEEYVSAYRWKNTVIYERCIQGEDSDIFFAKGKYSGISKTYTKRGYEKTAKLYKEGNLTKIIVYFKKHIKFYEAEISNGKYNGKVVFYDNRGRIRCEEFYKDGLIDEPAKCYYGNNEGKVTCFQYPNEAKTKYKNLVNAETGQVLLDFEYTSILYYTKYFGNN